MGDRLWGIRLDTPASRRGDFRKIIEEVRWELDIRGGKHVRIIASGKIDEDDVANLKDLVDGFGIGTSVAYPPLIDFSAKIVEVYDKGVRSFRAKRGGLGGKKYVYRKSGYQDVVSVSEKVPQGYKPVQHELIRGGKIVIQFETIEELRKKIVKKLEILKHSNPTLTAL